jgi:hypothetical protein
MAETPGTAKRRMLSQESREDIVRIMNDSDAFFRLLDELGVPHETDEHDAVFTAHGLADQEAMRWEFPVKNIFVEDKNKLLYLVTMRLDTPPLDLKELAKAIGAAGRFSFAKPEILAAALGVTPGAVTPFGGLQRSRQESLRGSRRPAEGGKHNQRPPPRQYHDHHYRFERSPQALLEYGTSPALALPAGQIVLSRIARKRLKASAVRFREASHPLFKRSTTWRKDE